MTDQDAIAALREFGITNPSKSLIESWLCVRQYEETASPPPVARETVRDMQRCVSSSASLEDTTRVGRPSSESSLKPLLRERGELQRQPGLRKSGRPRIIAPWFEALATRMADGTSMRKALASLGIHLSQCEMRALYRSRALTAMRREARQKWLREWGIRHRTGTRRPKGCRGADCLGLSRQLLRSL